MKSFQKAVRRHVEHPGIEWRRGVGGRKQDVPETSPDPRGVSVGWGGTSIWACESSNSSASVRSDGISDRG
jgi:hypothetical protein